MGMMVAGFIPSPLGHVTQYTPTILKVIVGVYGRGSFILPVLWKLVVAIRERAQAAR